MSGMAKESQLQTDFELCYDFSIVNSFQIYKLARQSWLD